MILLSYGLCYINLHKLFMKSIFALMLYTKTKDFHMCHYFRFSQIRITTMLSFLIGMYGFSAPLWEKFNYVLVSQPTV